MSRMIECLSATALSVALPALASGQVRTVETVAAGTGGADLFKTYCASCHGKSGKGDGPLADVLRKPPPDLTIIARRSNAPFDAEKVRRMIDGRDPLNGHGGPDMPIWGDAFKRSSASSTEQGVKDRIQALVDYLKSIQVKRQEGR